MESFLYYSPLEQFEIIPLFSLFFLIFTFRITNQLFVLLLVIIFYSIFFISLTKSEDHSFYVIPTRWQTLVEVTYSLIVGIINDNIGGTRSHYFFPLIFVIFLFIGGLNIIGLVPYTFTVTSHIITTLALSLTIFLGMNIICVRIHGIKFFTLFLPSGTSLYLALLLVPVELLSYISKPISLAVRLFCNMVAGHILLKVLAGFAWSLTTSSSSVLFLFQYFPLLVLVPLFGLEFGVAVIQAFVFSLLICIYLNDILNLH